ncbi:hypothetical protein Scep_003803 [Stephania cephalantha]|uniref:Uncharacterized protein n=1 Tax=Stephania cephalantha TaxID=152367 RepID=A0AAP0KTZ3_9MAGN
MTRMVQLNMGPKRLVRLTVSVLITLIHPSHYLVELNKSHGDSSLYRQLCAKLLEDYGGLTATKSLTSEQNIDV